MDQPCYGEAIFDLWILEGMPSHQGHKGRALRRRMGQISFFNTSPPLPVNIPIFSFLLPCQDKIAINNLNKSWGGGVCIKRFWFRWTVRNWQERP